MRPQDLTPNELGELLHRAYLQDLGEDVDEVEYWLDVEFVEPCPGR